MRQWRARHEERPIGDDGTRWPAPAPEPADEPVDEHRGPLDEIEHGRYLDESDPRRLDAERRRGRRFDDDVDPSS